MAFLLISQQKQATHSEMPLALQHLYATSDLYKDILDIITALEESHIFTKAKFHR